MGVRVPMLPSFSWAYNVHRVFEPNLLLFANRHCGKESKLDALEMAYRLGIFTGILFDTLLSVSYTHLTLPTKA